MATLRVVLDTNVLLSGIAYLASIPGKIMAAWRHRLTTGEIDDRVGILSIHAGVIEPLDDHEAELRDIDDQPTGCPASLWALPSFLRSSSLLAM